MHDTIAILKVILPLVISLGIGYFSRKRAILSQEGIEGMKTFVVKFALPAMLFMLFFTANYTIEVPLFAATTFVLGFAGFGLGILIGKPLEKRSPMLKFMTAGWEVGMLGYALYALLYGAENLRYMAMMDLGQALFMFTVFMTALNARMGCTLRKSIKSQLLNPILWAVLSGVALALLGVPRALAPSGVTDLITSLCNFIAAPLSCVILIVVGYGIGFDKRNIGTAVIAAAMRVAVCGGLCVAALAFIGSIIPLSDVMRMAIVIFLLSPSTYILTMFTLNQQEQADVSMSLTLQSLVTIFIFIFLAIFRF